MLDQDVRCPNCGSQNCERDNEEYVKCEYDEKIFICNFCGKTFKA